uniref:Translation initiation factor IF-1, chloroplastic n=3 Tax=Jasminum TaxID=4147 RepID=A0A4D5Y0L4_JASFL|nr:translation initiation factor 1 [Jasminum tortuosum]YP_009634330.1 translation initiation factor 1 [Jasminum fluminense]ARJ61475.1 translation initiation factor 1 [Jasminum tortuosum]QBS49345.1 translation initiation factor 1 [Jasminum fluminense]QCD15806.1 translation initiation factor 1 [Jasminum kitchingii]
MKEKDAKWVVEGLVTEAHPNGMFRVQLDNGARVLGYISGKIRRNSIRIMQGDRVQIELSHYDLTKGRIIYRLPPIPKPKDSEDDSED